VLTFGIIGEGFTDQIVLEQILIGFFRDQDPLVTYVQPPPLGEIQGSGEPAPGGWDLVFKSIAQGDHVEAAARNDYVVLQIDTDVSEQKGYDVPHRDGGRELGVDELAARVIDKLTGLMGAGFYAAHARQFIFAIAVHSVECWLLPLLYNDAHVAKITGCLEAANEALRRKNMLSLSKPGRRGQEKDPQSYRKLSREYTRRKRLMELRDKNASLALFIRQLDAISPGTSSGSSST
jgi:hypothetical protein